LFCFFDLIKIKDFFLIPLPQAFLCRPENSVHKRMTKFYGSLDRALNNAAAAIPAFTRVHYNRGSAFCLVWQEKINLADIDTPVATRAFITINNYRICCRHFSDAEVIIFRFSSFL
jgi:hypothetical protein